jgi:hypothetical protein
MPRPTKLSPERQAQICGYVTKKHSRKITAQACGIAATTVYHWIKRGEYQPDKPYGEFCRTLKWADLKAELVGRLL